jgi:hypothetical protein
MGYWIMAGIGFAIGKMIIGLGFAFVMAVIGTLIYILMEYRK